MLGKKIIITIVEQSGFCDAGLKKGREFVYEGKLPDICPAAWDALYPYLRVLQFGGNLPWEEEGEAYVACPDHKNPVVFKLERK